MLLTLPVAAKRTPMCKAHKGALKEAFYEDMLAAAFKGVIGAAGIDPKLIEDIQVGTVRTPRGGASISRMAAFHAGIPYETSLATVNRQCSSSLQAIWTIANEIRTGDIDIGIAAGCESMTRHYKPVPLDHPTSDAVMQTKRK
jgi:acetyl-CoA acyltransferase 1